MNTAEWNVLRVSLAKSMQRWVERETKYNNADCVGYFTNEVVALMADAALLILKASADKEEWLRENEHMKD